MRLLLLIALMGGLLDCKSSSSACPAPTSSFYCIVGGCQFDVTTDPICMDGDLVCPTGSVDTRTCGGCVGQQLPGCTCHDAGVTCVDAGTDGASAD